MQLDMQHFDTATLEASLDHIRAAPAAEGSLDYLVRRPATGEREVLTSGELDLEVGLVGDNWLTRGSRRTDNGLGHPDMQLNIMNVRVVALIAGTKERWALAGDQLYVDLDLSKDNLPPGTRLQVGNTVVEVTEIPHLGCKKFQARFGLDAMRFVNSKIGRQLRLRGLNAKVITAGTVTVGDAVRRI